MEYFNRDALETLARTSAENCVSLFMPTYHVEAERSQNAIRLKNLLREARRQLSNQGLREAQMDALLLPLHQLMERADWGTLSDGLTAFVTLSDAHFYRVPLDLEELVVTGTRFHLKPLFPLLASNNRFYVLALSQNSVRLYQGSHYAIQEVEARDIPKSLVDALFYDNPERSIQFHTGNRAGGRHDAVYHGQGVQDEEQRSRPQDALRRFFKEIDNGIHNILNGEDAPLLLAGVEHYLPIYREANSYRQLIEDQIIAGNPDHYTLHDLHDRAWMIIEPRLHEAEQASLEQFQHLHNKDGLASTDVHEIIPAAVYSRIETLFVPVGQHLWGRYDPEQNAVTIHDEQQAADEDLYDFAAVQTYLNGGTVHALQPDNMPVESGVAATFRYPAQVEAVEEA